MKKLAALGALTALAGCSSLPQMGSASSYATYSCDQIQKEIAVVQQHEEANREAGSFGAMDFALALLGGVAAGHAQYNGNYAQSQQIIQTVEQNDQQRKAFSATADTLSERARLLNKLSTAKKCS